jgi:hypothetical protein
MSASKRKRVVSLTTTRFHGAQSLPSGLPLLLYSPSLALRRPLSLFLSAVLPSVIMSVCALLSILPSLLSSIFFSVIRLCSFPCYRALLCAPVCSCDACDLLVALLCSSVISTVPPSCVPLLDFPPVPHRLRSLSFLSPHALLYRYSMLPRRLLPSSSNVSSLQC